MPIYEYSCSKCGKKFEKLVLSLSGKTSNPECPKCGSKDVDKVYSSFSSGGDKNRSSQVNHSHTHSGIG